MQSRFKVFTITDSPSEDPRIQRLRRSAEKYEIPLAVVHVLGMGGTYESFLEHKHRYIAGVLARISEPRFLYLDAWDTVFTGEVPLEVFSEVDLCFGAEKNCYPDKSLELNFDQTVPFPYLNSGVIWGNTNLALELTPTQVEHDQLAWTKQYLLTPERIHLDTHARHVLNLHSTSPEDLSYFPDGVRYNPTSTWPFILHGNGKWPLPQWVE